MNQHKLAHFNILTLSDYSFHKDIPFNKTPNITLFSFDPLSSSLMIDACWVYFQMQHNIKQNISFDLYRLNEKTILNRITKETQNKKKQFLFIRNANKDYDKAEM